MARIPTYDSRANITTESPKAPIDPRQAANLGGEIVDVGKGLTTLGAHFDKMRDFQEKSSAMHLLRQSVQKRYVDTLNNKDVWGTLDKVDDGFMEDINNSASHITSQEARDKFISDANSYVDRKGISLELSVRNKQSQLTKVTTIQQMDEQIEDVLSSSPNEHAVALDEFKKYTEEAIKTSGVNEVALRTHYNHLMRTLPEKMFTSDLGRADQTDDPKTYLKGIENELKKSDGWYKDLPAEKQDWAFKQLEQANKRADAKVVAVKRNANHISDGQLAWKLGQGALTQDDIEKARPYLTPSRYDSYIKSLNTQASTLEHPQAFADMMDLLSDEKTTQREFVDKLLEYKNSEGEDSADAKKLSDDEYSKLIKLGMIDPEKDPVFQTGLKAKYEELTKSQLQKDEMVKKNKENAGGFWHKITSIFGKDKSHDVAKEVVNKIAEQKTKPEDYSKVADQVITDTIKTKLSNKGINIDKFPEGGQVVKLGAVYWTIKPDGTYHISTDQEVNGAKETKEPK